MAIDFPSSPTPGQVFTDGDHTWEWSATTGVVGAWKLQTTTTTGPTGPTGAIGATGPTGPTGAQGAIGTSNIAIFRDEKTDGTNGGSFTSGDWRTRTLNTTQTNGITGCSLSSNQITLPEGTYYIQAIAPTAGNVNNHKARLENVTDATTAILGQNAESRDDAGANPGSDAFVEGVFTIAAQKTFELQHRCGTTENTIGFGAASSFGVAEVYATITIIKLT